MEAYRIADEPRPGPLQQLAVNPVWPLFGLMFGGVWLAFPWFVFNALALGSPTVRREILLVLGGLVGCFGIAFGILAIVSTGNLAKSNLPYLLLALTVWKLAIGYWTYVIQSRTFGVYVYYGGVVRNAFFVVLIGFYMNVQVVYPALKSNALLLVALR